MQNDFIPLLLGKDLRSIGRSNAVVQLVDNQRSFDALFSLLFHHERILVMRAADAIEKITSLHPDFIQPHRVQLMSLLRSAINKELKWHIALLMPRINLEPNELKEVWSILTYWARNPNESKIVRVNSVQGLFELSRQFQTQQSSFEQTLQVIEHEPIPSLKARIKRIRKLMH